MYLAEEAIGKIRWRGTRWSLLWERVLNVAFVHDHK